MELNEAEFTGCNLPYANFSGSTMKGVDFSGCPMGHASLDGTNLSAAILVDCEFRSREADRVTLDHAALRGGTLSGREFRKIDMTGVKINPEQAATLPEQIGLEVTNLYQFNIKHQKAIWRNTSN